MSSIKLGGVTLSVTSMKIDAGELHLTASAAGPLPAGEAHIYTIDVFLWFMAMHGYTLQRSRARVDFEDLAAKVAALKDQDAAAFRALLDINRPSEGATTDGE